MSKEDQYIEKIHQYFDRELSETEKVAFEKQLNQDPLLREEFELQKSLIESIKNYRKAELKSRLDNISVPTAMTDGGTTSALKLGGALVLAAAIGVGIYFYFSEPKNESLDGLLDENIEIVDEPMLLPPTAKTQDIEAIAGEETYPEDYRQNEEKPARSVETERGKESTGETSKEKNPNEEISGRMQPEMMDDFIDDESLPSEEDVVVPENFDETPKESKIAELEIFNNTDSKYDFHYQHFGDKLYLFGNFDATPYEILEFNGADSKNIYLYYDGKYYGIGENVTEISRLKEISDQNIIAELNKIREIEN